MGKQLKVIYLNFILIIILILPLALTSCNSENTRIPVNTPTIRTTLNPTGQPLNPTSKSVIEPTEEPNKKPADTGINNKDEYLLTVLSTNDIHGYFETMPGYATIIKQVRNEQKNVILLDAGDLFKRGKYENYQGKIEIDLLNEMGYNAMVLGNNEFKVPGSKNSKKNSGTLQESDSQISNLVKWAKFPILCGNVKLKDTDNYIEGIKPYTIVNVNGMKVGIIGITSTSPEEDKLEMTVNKNFTSGLKVVKELLPEVKSNSDIQIVLSHAGMSINKKIKDVSAVISGHDHMTTFKPIDSNGIPIIQAGGEDMNHLGRLDLNFKHQGNEWVLDSYNGKLYSAEGIAKDDKVKSIIDGYIKR